jgi:D-methionine transport system substrate-binding protein
MKKTIVTAVLAVVTVAAFAAGKANDKNAVLTVGATPVPHAQLLALVADDLAKEGITLKVVEFTDYVTPNEAVESGQIDANFFQHVPYQETFNKDRGFHLVSVAGIHVEPLALYSKKFKRLADIPAGAAIAIPNDPTNEGRALLLLQSAGLVTIKKEAGLTATPVDLVSNPKKLKFKEIEAASLPRVLGDADAAVINGNYALPAGLAAAKDGLLVEGKDSPYVNIVTVKAGNENDPRIKALVKALTSRKVKDYILKSWPNGDVVPVF